MTTVAAKTLDGVAAQLKLEGVDLVITEFPGLAIEDLGVGGYCPSAHLVFVAIDPDSQVFSVSDAWHEFFISTIAHELHHAKRWQGPGYGLRLIDSMVSEGLATMYETAWTGTAPLYAKIEADISALWQQAAPIAAEHGHHAEWFFGSETVPRWAGYAVGTALVGHFMETMGVSAEEAAWIPSDDFWQTWVSK